MSLTPEQEIALERAVRAELWRRGDLSYLRYPHHQRVVDLFQKPDVREHYTLWTRRGMKSGGGVILSLEACLRPGGRALMLAPTAKSAAEIATDIAAKLLRDCPPDCRPEYSKQDKEFTWKDRGSVWRLKGVNGETFENLRGGEYDVVILDECAKYDELEEIIYGVVMPMVLTTKGRILYQTTPPDSPGHYSVKLFRQMQEEGKASVVTLGEVTHIPYDEKFLMLTKYGEKPERIAGILDGTLEPERDFVQREYFCKFVVNRDLAVVPEFLDHKADVCVDAYPRPPFFDAYAAADMGMRDRTGIVLGYFDFLAQKIVVEGELLLNRANTAAVAASWATKEAELGYSRVHRVIDDPSLRVSADLTALGLTAMPVDKSGRDAAVAAMRVQISSGQLRIVNCPLLTTQLETAVYKKTSNTFERTEDGHFDLVDALIYLVRSVNRLKNPYPADWSPAQIHEGVAAWRPRVQRASRLNQAAFGGTPAGRKVLKRGRRR